MTDEKPTLTLQLRGKRLDLRDLRLFTNLASSLIKDGTKATVTVDSISQSANTIQVIAYPDNTRTT